MGHILSKDNLLLALCTKDKRNLHTAETMEEQDMRWLVDRMEDIHVSLVVFRVLEGLDSCTERNWSALRRIRPHKRLDKRDCMALFT